MSEEKNQALLDQPGSWFLNRGLFSDHFLKARLPQWKEWQANGDLATFRKQLLSLYESTKPIMAFLNEPQTEKEFVQPVLDLLGYANSYIVQAPTQVGEHTNRPDYALFPDQTTKNKAYERLKNNDYALCIGVADAKYWERELDLAKSSNRDTFTNQNPSFQIATYLTGTKQTWGILTNGRLWRLYCAKSHLPLGNYYQVDLVQLLEKAPEENLKYFYLFFRKAALIQVDGKSFLDRVLEDSNQYAVELEADIKERAYDVVEILCHGFAAGFSHDQLTEQALKTIYDNSLTLLYRLLFVFYAEARELLPSTTNQSYREKYSIHKLTQEIDEALAKGYQLSSKSTIYYQRISGLSKLINEGDRDLGVPEYNGGLFDPEEHPFLEQHAIADAFLVQAIHQLARIPDKKLGREVAVDYNTLSERHLGSIYEGLLEFKPRIAPPDLVTIKDKGSIKYALADKYPDKKVAYKKDELYLANDKGERKASGSYYTPEYIVNYIVENTLDPLTREAHEKVKALKPEVDKVIAKWEKLKGQKQGLEPTDKYDRKIAEERERLLEPYLSLKVLDPAMGSGHFLARATDFLAEAIATDPYIKPPLKIAEESELTYYRRRVVESCIYGVDLNPLAVELAKLTLWLGTMAKSKPLSFLNHHLRVGNSLIGARVADLDEIPKRKGKRGKPFDTSRAPVQLGIFQEAFNKKLYDLLQNRALIAQLPSETLEDIHNKEKWEQDFEHNAERFRTLADLWVSTYFDNNVRWDEYNALVENLQSTSPEWERLIEKEYVKKALVMREERHFFHWELEFPEVFYDKKGNRKSNLGFDVVIGNPPYDVLEKERLGKQNPHIELAQYLENSPSYYPALGGKVNLFRPFLIQECRLLKHGGVIGKIVPLAIANDFSCARTRNYILKELSLLQLECFPQKDDPRDRVFEDAKLSTCILIANKAGETTKFTVRIYPGKSLTDNPKKVDVSLKDIESVDPGVLPIPLVTQAEWNLAVKIHSFLPISCISQIATLTRGEINQTTFSKFITSNQLHHEMIKGVEIDRYGEHLYLSQGEKQWFDKDSFHAKTKSHKAIPPFRIGVQRITGIDDRIRLIATLINRSVYFADSTNSIVSDDPEKLYFVLSLLNSRFFNWRFKLTSTNNNVSTNELDRLPIRSINFITPQNERKQLLEKSKSLYQEYQVSHDWGKVLAFVGECLPQETDGTPDMEQEKSDVIHDLLAFLAEEMTQLNKEKQSKIKGFLTWLEKEILKGSVEDQKNKTRIKDFHNNTFEDLLDVLKRNKVVKDPCPANIRDTIASEFSAAVNALTPLKARIKATDDLIDGIVYRLYGFTDDEIAIVKGQQSHDTAAQN
jgi:Alw26I/Eco31I/Esp3I family type II restriction m6 adenine DNA methyltransferase